jgi:agarase
MKAGRVAIAAGVALMAAFGSAWASDGFFTVGEDAGRWWLFDPDGERFFSTGINVATAAGYYCPSCGTAPYHDNILMLYGSEEAWAEVTADRLAAWNFNTIGAWSDNHFFADEFPYTVIFYLSGADWQSGAVPDYWAPEFYERVEDGTAPCTDLADDPLLVGYFLDNEMRWGPDWRRIADLYADYISFPAFSPGKTELIEWLRERYDNNILSFNAVHEMHLRSFNELHKVFRVSPWPKSARQADDREAWTGHVADHFFQVTTEAVRAKDPNHLILGTRFVSWVTPTAVLEAAAPYLDVVSVNHYLVWWPFQWLVEWLHDEFRFVRPLDMLEEFHTLAQKPLMISEFSVRGLDAAPPSTWPPPWLFMTAPDQAARTAWMLDYARQCVAAPYCLGYHWFAYMDEPEEGRFDGEDSNFGLVDEMDVPYDLLVNAFTEVNLEAYDWPR